MVEANIDFKTDPFRQQGCLLFVHDLNTGENLL